MPNVKRSDRSEWVGRGWVSLSAWPERVAIGAMLGAVGCGAPFLELSAPDRGDAGDASISDALRDGFFDRASDGVLRDTAVRDATGVADTGSTEPDSRGGAVDAADITEAGRDGPPHGDADSSVLPDATGTRDVSMDVGGGAGDANRPSDHSDDGVGDASRPSDHSDGGASDTSGPSGDAQSDASIDGDADVDLDTTEDDGADPVADAGAGVDGFVCGFQPAPTGGECPAVCNGGCAAGICTIACSGELECKGATLECPSGFACEVNCVGKQSCESALVMCGEIDACKLLCAGDQSCKKVELICRSGTCSAECLGSTQTCQEAVVNCGPQACAATCQNAKSRPKMNCGPSCDCRPCP